MRFLELHTNSLEDSNEPPSSAAGPKTCILKGLEYRVKVEKTEEVNTKSRNTESIDLFENNSLPVD